MGFKKSRTILVLLVASNKTERMERRIVALDFKRLYKENKKKRINEKEEMS